MIVCGKEIKVQGRVIRIARPDADKFQFLDDPEALLDGLRKSEKRVDLFTFMQIMPETSPKYAYPMEWDNLAVLQVYTFDTWWTKQIDAKTRNMVRKADKKGLQVREVQFDEAIIHGIWEIYNECPVRQGRRFPHFGKDLETVRQEEATYLDRSIFIGAYLGNKLIGFIKLLCDERQTQAGLLNIVSLIQHRDKAPTNALVAQAVRSCAERGIPYLVYSNFSYGKKQRDTLSDFKHNNGFRRIDLPRYYVPLTPIGSAAYRLGLYKKLSDHFPESVLTMLRELRNIWYSRRFGSVMEAS
jgi:hypothetical protein